MASLAQQAHRPVVSTPTRPFWVVHQDRLAPALVVITLAGLAASLLLEGVGALTTSLVLLANLISYGAGGFYGTISALESLRRRRLDIDLLMILAALGAASIGQWREGALLLFLFSLSNVLQDYAIGRSRRAISSLMKLNPSEARVVRDGVVTMQPVAELRIGDVVQILPGERIPVDGLVTAGQSSIDQSPITGESMPVTKRPGDAVFAGTLNQQGTLDVQATQGAQDTMLARIIQMVESAQENKAPTEYFLERFEEIYAFVILAGVALMIVIPPLFLGANFERNFYTAMVLMTVASPCALVISTPAAFLSAIATAARRGILFKGGAYLENLATVKAVAFDKTGTLTQGTPAVTDVIAASEVDESVLLSLAASVESRSEHPLAAAIVTAARDRGLSVPDVSGFAAVTGEGVCGQVAGQQIMIGRPLEAGSLAEPLHRLQRQGKTVVAVSIDGTAAGLIALADQVRDDALPMLAALRAMGIAPVMLTGDNPYAAQLIASQLGIEHVEAGLLPGEKLTAIQRLQNTYGLVAMVGDGINDAPALAAADIGMAMGAAGTDVALETADVVLMNDRLSLIPTAFQISRKARQVVWQNIAFSLAVIGVLIVATFAVDLALPVGVLGHEGSTVIVATNGLLQLLLLPELMRRRAVRG